MKSIAKQLLATCALFAACLVAPIAHATDYELVDDQFDSVKWLTIEMLGMHPGSAFVRFKSGANFLPSANPSGALPNGLNCLNGVFYVDITQTHGRLIYQQLLLAKTAGKKVSRIGFSQASTNQPCFAWLVAQIE